jgi:hypothetical protein
MSRDEDVERMSTPEDPEENQDFRVYPRDSEFQVPLKAKIIFWSTLAGGIALGTFLFLFFVSLFVYLFLPLTAVFLIYQLFLRLRK